MPLRTLGTNVAALNNAYVGGRGVLLYHNGTAYPALPSGAAQVEWVGPSVPTSARPGDTWRFRPPTTPRPVIFDTDWWTDPDDAVSVRHLCHAERLGLIDIRACIIDTYQVRLPGSLSTALTYEGRPDLPIGIHPSYVPTGTTPTWHTNLYDTFTHTAGLARAMPTDVDMYRRALAEAADHSVDIISTGYCTSLQRLLASTADSISSLTGAQLVALKVRKLWLAAGRYPAGSENNFTRDATAAAAGQATVDGFTTAGVPITAFGVEPGTNVIIGSQLSGDTATDPIALALNLTGYGTGRSAWGGMVSWMAALGDLTTAGYTSVKGTISVNGSTGANTFAESTGGPHEYVIKTAPDQWFAADLNKRLLRTRGVDFDPLPAIPPGTVNGVHQVAEQRTRAPKTPTAVPSRQTTNTANLIFNVKSDDFFDLTVGNVISHWDDRMYNRPARQLTNSLRPTVDGDVNVRYAKFTGAQRMTTDSYLFPKSGLGTVYARVRFDVLPTGSQSVISADDQNSTVRIFSLKVGASGQVIASAFLGVGGQAATAGNLVAGQRAVIAMRYSPTTMQAFLDGTPGTATGRSGQNFGQQAIVLGSKFFDANGESMVGNLAGARVYAGVYHDDATIAAVTAEMQTWPSA